MSLRCRHVLNVEEMVSIEEGQCHRWGADKNRAHILGVELYQLVASGDDTKVLSTNNKVNGPWPDADPTGVTT